MSTTSSVNLFGVLSYQKKFGDFLRKIEGVPALENFVNHYIKSNVKVLNFWVFYTSRVAP